MPWKAAGLRRHYLEYSILICSICAGDRKENSLSDNCTRVDQLFQNRDDETVHGRTGGVAEAQNPGNRHETVEETENHLLKPMLSEQETPKRIQP